jgi:Gram-negative porin
MSVETLALRLASKTMTVSEAKLKLARLALGHPMLTAHALVRIFGAIMLLLFVTRGAHAANGFELRTSGYFNLTTGGVLHGAGRQTGSSVGVVPEGEIELTPQYHLGEGGTILAARVAINTSADVGQSFQSEDLSIPEVSAFVIGRYGRFEVGERAAFPQSLVGFTPSEIAFTAAEFGPESGARLDPDGRLPPSFLQSSLASRINALTYLGYSERFYDVRSPKLIYISPRIDGFYMALSYCPRTVRSEGFQITHTATPSGMANDPFANAANLSAFNNLVQTALVYNRRTEDVDLTVGTTFSHASPGEDTPTYLGHEDANSINAGITAIFEDTWVLGASANYDGFSGTRPGLPPALRRDPFGIIGSINYVDGPWVLGSYYQYATAPSTTVTRAHDQIQIVEVGLSYLLDQNHDLLGKGFYTDLKAYTSAYYYDFETDSNKSRSSYANAAVFVGGLRFSFF